MEVQMEKESWEQIAERMRFDEGATMAQIVDCIAPLLPELDKYRVYERARRCIRKSPRYKKIEQQDLQRSSIEYKSDGAIVSEKFITVRDGVEMTPEFILDAHGLDVSRWEVVSYKNNFWNSQIKGGYKQISYQSKLTAKPKTDGVDLKSVLAFYKDLSRKGLDPIKHIEKDGDMLAVINIADLHFSKLCWHGDTPADYDHKIAREVFREIVGENVARLVDLPVRKILFVWANDFFNSENEQKTTTAGTPQDTDVRHKKMFNVGCEMLIQAVDAFEQIAPVETFYTPSNHDEETAYHALGVLSAWFRNDQNVTVNTDAYPRKYVLYGKTLLGFTHGDKENSTGTKEKASRLASLMPIEAREMWGESVFHEFQAAHLHSEQMIQEINGVIVRRVSSPTALDSWHVTNGYMGAVRKAQTFIYEKERGLVQIINVPVG